MPTTSLEWKTKRWPLVARFVAVMDDVQRAHWAGQTATEW